MLDRCWDFLVDTLMVLFMPAVCSYFAISGSLFLNVSVQGASGLEKWGNTLLTPVQYVLAGSEAIEQPDGTWKLEPLFDYSHHFWLKTAGSVIAIPPSLVLGSFVKALSFCSATTRHRFATLQNLSFQSNREEYVKWGLQIDSLDCPFISQKMQRRPGDENVMAVEKEALRDITILLNQAQIPWWVDCGTCLGTYRYGGIIPWDADIDIAVLLPDFDNICATLQHLDPKKYIVQNWSSRDYPKSYLKVYIVETGTMIDIYHFKMIPELRELQYILSLENNIFFPEWWKIRERRFKVPVSYDTVFPLRTASFDGIEVFVPNDPEKYLQRYYGDNLAPAKVFNPMTSQYEKDLTHPYWQTAYVH